MSLLHGKIQVFHSDLDLLELKVVDSQCAPAAFYLLELGVLICQDPYLSTEWKGLDAKEPFFVFKPLSQDQKGLSDSNKLLFPLSNKMLFK